MGGADGWSFDNYRSPGTSWAKASNPAAPQVMTASGLTIDFFSSNFDVKHLMVVSSTKSFNGLLNDALLRKNVRASGKLAGHGAAKVSKSTINSVLIVTLDMLAALGGDVARQFKAMKAPSHHFKGTPQWNIHSELKSAVCMTHSKKDPVAGMGASISLTIERSGSILKVVHLHAATIDANRQLDVTKANKVNPGSAADATRQERFDRQFAPEPADYGLTSLFG